MLLLLFGILFLSLVSSKRHRRHHDNAKKSIDDILDYIDYLDDEIAAYDNYFDNYYDDDDQLYDDMNLLQELLSESRQKQKTQKVQVHSKRRRRNNRHNAHNRLIDDKSGGYRGYNGDYKGFASRFIENNMMMNNNGLSHRKLPSLPSLPDEFFVDDIPELHHELEKPSESSLAKLSKDPPPPPKGPKGPKPVVKVLYHATNKGAATAICKSKKMKLGSKGAFGAGIYFADNADGARLKAMLSLGDRVPIGGTDLSKYPGVLGQGEYVIKASVVGKWLWFKSEFAAKEAPILPQVSEYDDMMYAMEGPTGNLLRADVRSTGAVTWNGQKYTYLSYATILKNAKANAVEVDHMGYNSYGDYGGQVTPWVDPKSISADYVSNTDLEHRAKVLLGAEYVAYKPGQVKVQCVIPKKDSPPIEDCGCK